MQRIMYCMQITQTHFSVCIHTHERLTTHIYSRTFCGVSSVPTLQVLQDVLTREEEEGQIESIEGGMRDQGKCKMVQTSYKHHSQGLPGGREYLGGGENEAK